MTEPEAKEILGLLAKEFKISVPNLSWTNQAKRGRAFTWGQNRIAIGPRCWRGPEAALLHEFTHILCWRLTGSHIRSCDHTEYFWRMLEKVSLAWYGNDNAYPWNTEYKRGQAWAGRAKK